MAVRRLIPILGLLVATGCGGYLDHIPPANSGQSTPRAVEVELPRDATYRFLRHRQAIYLGDNLDALEQLRAAAVADADSAALRTRLGEQYFLDGKHEQAIGQWEQALRLEPDYCMAHHWLGRLAAYRGDESAESHLNATVECDPYLEEAWQDLAILLDGQGRYDDELRLLDQYGAYANSDEWTLRRRGQVLRKLGRDEEAILSLRQALEVTPEDASSRAFVLRIYSETGRLDEGAALLEDLVLRYPSMMELRDDLGRVYASLGRYDEVIDQLLSEYEQDPVNRKWYALDAADWFERLMRYDEALEMLDRTIEEYPDDDLLHIKRGYIMESAGDLEGAIETWEAVSTERGFGTLAAQASARLLGELGRPEEGIELLRQALVKSRENGVSADPEIGTTLARMLGEAGEYEEARGVLDEFRTEAPRVHARNLARLHWSMGQRERAIVLLGEEIKKDGIVPDAATELADLYREAQLYEEAAETLEAALQQLEAPTAEQQLPVGLFPTRSMRFDRIQQYRTDLLISLGFIRGFTGDSEGAIQAMRDALVLAPDEARALNFIGYTNAVAGNDLEEAEQLIRQALTLNPLDPSIMDSLGWVLFQQGRYEEALEVLDDARKRMTKSAVIWQHLAETYLKLNRADEARSCLEESIRTVDAEDPEEVAAGERSRVLLDELPAATP